MEERSYIAIDLKSFYASVECMQRGLDPLDTCLVVADESRTEKTIGLAVSPALKKYGVPGRPRLFEVIQKVREANRQRVKDAPGGVFRGKSISSRMLSNDPSLEIDFLIAKPQMALYMQYSTRIFSIYSRFVSSEDIHVYSIDEVFIDVTDYLKTYKTTAKALSEKMVNEVLKETGVTATVGIGTNLYLAKVAMDIVAKHIPANESGAKIAELDEMSYRKLLWDHRPLTDFWRVGKGYQRRLEKMGLYTMGDVARCSAGKETDYYNEKLLYDAFGVNAELLIDHAWGYEPCRISDIKAYKPETHSISQGQVLQEPYDFDKARLIVREMTDQLALEMVDKKITCDQMVLTVGYDIENISDGDRMKKYKGPFETDPYGRKIPKSAHGSINLTRRTSSARIMLEAISSLYDRIVDPSLLARRMYVVANHVEDEEREEDAEQLDMFTDYEKEDEALDKEKRRQHAILGIKKKFGANAILRGMNLQEGATARDRNQQIGGHKA
ncbi:MAG: DNA methylase [Clostridiales bacterium]|nr:DNA methylase [Clostridiales bacterium]